MDYENSHTNFGLMSTAFNEFLMLNKNIGFLLKLYHGFSKQYHIFDFQSLFVAFESLRKSVKFLMYAVVQNSNSKHFLSMHCCFKLPYSYSYVVVTLQLYIVKNSKFKEEKGPAKRP